MEHWSRNLVLLSCLLSHTVTGPGPFVCWSTQHSKHCFTLQRLFEEQCSCEPSFIDRWSNWSHDTLCFAGQVAVSKFTGHPYGFHKSDVDAHPVQMQDDMRKTINEKVKEAQKEIKPGKGGSKGKSRKEPEAGKRKKDQACCIIGSFAEQDLYPSTTYLLTKSRMQLLCLIFLTLYTSPKPELCRRRCRLVPEKATCCSHTWKRVSYIQKTLLIMFPEVAAKAASDPGAEEAACCSHTWQLAHYICYGIGR